MKRPFRNDAINDSQKEPTYKTIIKQPTSTMTQPKKKTSKKKIKDFRLQILRDEDK